MRMFFLRRLEDETGISGTGIVAEGVMFANGKCAISWLTQFTSVAVYDNLDTVEAIHGHGGKTRIEFRDPEIRAKDLDADPAMIRPLGKPRSKQGM